VATREQIQKFRQELTKRYRSLVESNDLRGFKELLGTQGTFLTPEEKQKAIERFNADVYVLQVAAGRIRKRP
jgi:aspartate/tyrosine/aromatic aminotransferase